MCFLLHQSAAGCQAEEGSASGGRERPSPTASCWNWRKSSTSTLISVVPGGWRWPPGCSSLIARSRSGFRTAGWGIRRSTSMERWHWQVLPSGLPATRPWAQAHVRTSWGFQVHVLLELLPQSCTSWIMLLCPPPSLALTVTPAVVSVFTLQTCPISAVYFHLLQMVHRPPVQA